MQSSWYVQTEVDSLEIVVRSRDETYEPNTVPSDMYSSYVYTIEVSVCKIDMNCDHTDVLLKLDGFSDLYKEGPLFVDQKRNEIVPCVMKDNEGRMEGSIKFMWNQISHPEKRKFSFIVSVYRHDGECLVKATSGMLSVYARARSCGNQAPKKSYRNRLLKMSQTIKHVLEKLTEEERKQFVKTEFGHYLEDFSK